MSKIKLLSIVAIGLFIANLLLIGFIILPNPNHPREGGPKNIIIKKLNFDEQQQREYDELIASHRAEIRQTEEKIRILKNQLYRTVAQDAAHHTKDSLISELGKAQMQIENIHYKHFEDIKKLCKENQQQEFSNLVQEIASLFSPIAHKRK